VDRMNLELPDLDYYWVPGIPGLPETLPGITETLSNTVFECIDKFDHLVPAVFLSVRF